MAEGRGGGSAAHQGPLLPAARACPRQLGPQPCGGGTPLSRPTLQQHSSPPLLPIGRKHTNSNSSLAFYTLQHLPMLCAATGTRAHAAPPTHPLPHLYPGSSSPPSPAGLAFCGFCGLGRCGFFMRSSRPSSACRPGRGMASMRLRAARRGLEVLVGGGRGGPRAPWCRPGPAGEQCSSVVCTGALLCWRGRHCAHLKSALDSGRPPP